MIAAQFRAAFIHDELGERIAPQNSRTDAGVLLLAPQSRSPPIHRAGADDIRATSRFTVMKASPIPKP